MNPPIHVKNSKSYERVSGCCLLVLPGRRALLSTYYSRPSLFYPSMVLSSSDGLVPRPERSRIEGTRQGRVGNARPRSARYQKRIPKNYNENTREVNETTLSQDKNECKSPRILESSLPRSGGLCHAPRPVGPPLTSDSKRTMWKRPKLLPSTETPALDQKPPRAKPTPKTKRKAHLKTPF
jgi:hypothetical protein